MFKRTTKDPQRVYVQFGFQAGGVVESYFLEDDVSKAMTVNIIAYDNGVFVTHWSVQIQNKCDFSRTRQSVLLGERQFFPVKFCEAFPLCQPTNQPQFLKKEF